MKRNAEDFKQLIGISQEDLLYLLGMARLDINKVKDGRKKVGEISKKYIGMLGDTPKTIISEINTLKRYDMIVEGDHPLADTWVREDESVDGDYVEFSDLENLFKR